MLNNVFGMTPVGSILTAAGNVDPPANPSSGNRAAMSGTRTTTVQVDGAMVMGGVGISPTGLGVFGGAGVFSSNVTETQHTWGAGEGEFMANITGNPHTRSADADVVTAKVTETQLTRGARTGILTANVTETQTQLTQRRAIRSSKITKVLCGSDTPQLKRSLE